ncbi:DNA (cytosine-5-)-methyltransferase [Telmatobacter bradus]|uniref:DNA cytosine methyltransferase n=1 Tax=Telmatobacter bradus TaxID=474953 RepID=UPI003B42885B
MRYLSVCSGIEAVSVAWQPLGWEPAMFAEIDPFCCWLLRSRYRASRPQHMPGPNDAPTHKEAKRRAAAIRNIVSLPVDGDVINAGDFTKIGAEDVGTIDLLAGGTPCQSFSVAGKRAGLDDPRGNLTIEFARLADRLRPTWLVWENVPGVLSIDDGRTFGAFLGMLVQLGYGLSWRVLDAQYFGVPQRRRRVFVVGHLGNWRASAAVLFEFAGLSGYPPPRRETRKDLAPTLSARTHGGGGLGTDFDLDGGLIGDLAFGGNNTSGPIDVSTATNACATASGRIDFETETFTVHSLSSEGFDASEDGTGRGVPLISETLSTRYGDASDRDLPDSSAILPVAFNLRGREGGAMPEVSESASLRASAGGSTNSYIAFSAKDHGADADEIAPTLRGMGHDASHPNGGGQLAIAFTLHGSDGTATIASSTDIAGSLRTRAPGSIENSSTTAVLQEQSAASPLPPSYGEQADSSNVSSGSPNLIHAPMAVRRLTPRECERLQGFPCDYTLVEYRGKLAADGPRYRSLGNSMAVPVMRWIGERIAAVDAILRDGSGVRRRS